MYARGSLLRSRLRHGVAARGGCDMHFGSEVQKAVEVHSEALKAVEEGVGDHGKHVVRHEHHETVRDVREDRETKTQEEVWRERREERGEREREREREERG